jgi:pyridine nucleotide-disulfide oxidoreductase family protein
MTRLVLLGGGHAQLAVLASLAEAPLDGCEVRLVTPHRRQIYSGMLPGWVAGHYPIEACAIALDALAARGGVAFHRAAAIALDPSAGSIRCDDGAELSFDLLSIDTGPVAATAGLPGSLQHALPIRPIEGFVAAWPGIAERMRGAGRRFDLVVLGAGAAGVELAFAIRHRALTHGWSHVHVTLVGSDRLPLEGSPDTLRRPVAALLARRGIGWVGGRQAERVEANQLHFEAGAPLGFDACLVVTGAAAPAWPRAAGLATDGRGFVRVGPTLQSPSHPRIFAAGDIAAHASTRPKSGVFAVRAGPTLAHNLRASCDGRPLEAWHPQRRALYLISTGDRHAFASWGGWAWHGRWVWAWKDRIDRRFVRRFGRSD